ncbi:hypothetical protein VTK56DRAFT_10149 [Thermocarpiscus australiensis]
MASVDSTAYPSALQARQGRVVTQTLTRPSTTITVAVTLGDGPTSAPTIAATTPTTPPASPGPAGTEPPSPFTPQQVGAIVGSILGFASLVLLICCCLSCRRRRRRTAEYEAEDDDDTVSESDIQVVETLRTTEEAWNNHPRVAAPVLWTTVPPPVRIPPTPRHTPYRQTPDPQIAGVKRYP